MTHGEKERRWAIVLAAPWSQHLLTFEYESHEKGWDEKPYGERATVRGTLFDINLHDEIVYIAGHGCYVDQRWDNREIACDDLYLAIPKREVEPDAHGDMLFLHHPTGDFTVFGANSYMFRT